MIFLHKLLISIYLATTAHIHLKNKDLNIEIAVTEKERALGLMNRSELHKDQGMLFVFKESKILSFWMKDTKIPLSIAFFDEKKTIINIEHMNPTQGELLPLYLSKRPALYALEMSQGWFEENGIKVGDSFEWTERPPFGYIRSSYEQ